MERRGSTVICPVCTLYMREGVTLQHHLNTHPKDQVIAALVKISSGELRYKLASSLAASGQELPVLCRSTPLVTAQFSQPGSSHFTTAITYQHFLSSNDVPQYIPMPTVISETAICPASTNQTAFMQMVYNPYMMQQQQQVQLLNSIAPVPQQQTYIRHVLAPNIAPQTVELSPGSITISIPFSLDNVAVSEAQTFQTTQADSPLHDGNVASTSAASSTIISPAAAVAAASAVQTSRSGTSHVEFSTPDVRDEEQQTEGYFLNESSREGFDTDDDSPTIRTGKDETTQTVDTDDDVGVVQDLSGPSDFDKDKSESESEYESENEDSNETDAKETENVNGTKNVYENENADANESESTNENENISQTENVYDHENIGAENENAESDNVYETENVEAENENTESDNVYEIENENAESDNIYEAENGNAESDNEIGSQNELHIVPKETIVPTSIFTSVIPLVSENGSASSAAGGSFILAQDTNIANAECTSNANSSISNMASDMIQISGLVRNALEIQPPVLAENHDYMPSGYLEQRDNPNVSPVDLSGSCTVQVENSQLSTFVNAEPADTYTIINIDGVQIAVPDGLVQASTSLIITPDEPTRVVETLQTTEQCDPSFSSEPVLNIHTDETMPPKGELSEQESIGGNDSFMWTQAFNGGSAPCDLTARESWEGSDGSDVDVPAEHNQETTCVLPLKLQLKQSLKQPKVYTCAICNENFNCPKERRVHQSSSHGESSNGETSVETGEISTEAVEISKEPEKKASLTSTVNVRENEHTSVKESSSITEPVVHGERKRVQEETIVAECSKAKRTKQRDSVHGYLCSKCPEMFSSFKLRAAHESKEHKITKDVKNVCKTCNEAFENYSSFREHLKIHPLECSHCGKCFHRRQNLDLHIRRHLDIKPHKCNLCDKAFVTKQKLVEHVNTHTGNCPIKCPMCDETFRRYSNLIQHKNRHHLKKKKKIKDFICRCGEIYHSKKKLEWHKETHDETPKRCKYCTERFVHVASLTRHIRKAHDCRYVPEIGRTSENVECNICGFVFLKGSLQVHMRMHRGERPFSCHECGKDFTTKWNLRLHRWTHAARSTKPYKCNSCKGAFFRLADLAAHENSHRNYRPYTCNYCGRQFIRKYNCSRHVREHETGKAFTCNVCDKTFHRSYYLKEHLRVHSGIRPFSCHICGKASTTKSNHNKHVKIHHAREQVNTEG